MIYLISFTDKTRTFYKLFSAGTSTFSANSIPEVLENDFGRSSAKTKEELFKLYYKENPKVIAQAETIEKLKKDYPELLI